MIERGNHREPEKAGNRDAFAEVVDICTEPMLATATRIIASRRMQRIYCRSVYQGVGEEKGDKVIGVICSLAEKNSGEPVL
ncbi:MAG: hypothetical protein R2744_01210 [Bacteroidales bacterium]